MVDSAKKRLCLIDGSGYIYRAFYALPAMSRASDGAPVNAVYGFTSMLMQFIGDNADDCVAVVFDTSRKNFRNEIYSEYKANRKDVPEELIPQFPMIRDVVRAFNIADVEQEGYEADDLIASYTKKAVDAGYQVVIVSADKDLMQLMQDQDVIIYDPMKKRYLQPEDVVKKFGVLPDKVTQVQSLMGDSTDNIPGVYGIGAKTAADLINQYGDLDGIYAHLDDMTARRKELLENGKENAYISQKLVTLATDAPLPKKIEDFCSYAPETSKIKNFLESMGFRSLMTRVPSFVEKRCGIVAHMSKTSDAQLSFDLVQETPKVERFYECIQEEKDLLKWCKEIEKKGIVSIDTETDSLDSLSAKIVGISLCVETGKACYIPIEHRSFKNMSDTEDIPLLFDKMEEKPKQISKSFIREHLLSLLSRSEIIKIGHNLKFDLEVIYSNFGIDLFNGKIEDTSVMAYVLNGMLYKKKLDVLASIYLNENMIPYQQVCGTGRNEITFDLVDLKDATQYAAEDADMAFRLYHCLKPKLENEKLDKVYYDIDLPLIFVLGKMEKEGVLVDNNSLKHLSFLLSEKIENLENEICHLLGEKINLNSPSQLGEILFDKLHLEGGVRNSKTKSWSTDSEVLEKMSENGIEVASKLLEYRQYTKLKSTYTDALVKLINPKTGRVHTTFSQTMTTTGRLSSNNPNLQNIPIKTELGREIRSAFIAKSGCVLMSADYSQVELRLIAHVANVQQLKADFIAGLDIHAATASKVFGVPMDNMDPMVRRSAKAINFGIVYGISPFGLAKQLDISRTLAKEYIDSYFEKYPEIKTYMDETIRFASENGYVETLFGRRCYVSGFDSSATKGFASRAAINAPIQGGSADITKKAMIEIQNQLDVCHMKTKMLLQVHDELVFEVPEDEIEQMKRLVKNTMENVVQLSVPLVVDIGIGKNWKEAH